MAVTLFDNPKISITGWHFPIGVITVDVLKDNSTVIFVFVLINFSKVALELL